MPDARPATVTKHFFDAPWLVVEAEYDFVDLGNLLQQINLIVKEGTIENRNDGLGRMNRQRPQPRTLASCEKNRFHGNRSILS